MLIKNVTRQELEQALGRVNRVYDGNVTWNNCKYIGKTRQGGEKWRVTLWIKDHTKAGHRLGPCGLMGYDPRRRLHSACWHVHGDFFDALLDIAPRAYIITSQSHIYRSDKYDACVWEYTVMGNWQDFNIGSRAYPVYASEACDC